MQSKCQHFRQKEVRMGRIVDNLLNQPIHNTLVRIVGLGRLRLLEGRSQP
ncbi:hypothetical protein [Mucilaginibacter gilvus]|nr:hypothetical protein [Mucilaginibacter gilvus]